MASRTTISKVSPEWTFSIVSLLSDAVNTAGSATLFCGTSAIEPASVPRNTLLKTSTGKKEFGATPKCNVSNFPVVELIPLIRFRSMSMVTLPLATIIF
ncbi:MAG: hypothetical protein DME52_04800 [Verrucomicrobia bacterium]|nr:MAG: hypothetical protein DME52_04800 [Verrucomicrobiota bacterium]